MKNILKKLGIKIWFDKIRFKSNIRFMDFLEMPEGCIDHKSLGSYLLLLPAGIISIVEFCVSMPIILLANIKFGERE